MRSWQQGGEAYIPHRLNLGQHLVHHRTRGIGEMGRCLTESLGLLRMGLKAKPLQWLLPHSLRNHNPHILLGIRLLQD